MTHLSGSSEPLGPTPQGVAGPAGQRSLGEDRSAMTPEAVQETQSLDVEVASAFSGMDASDLAELCGGGFARTADRLSMES